MSKETLHIYSRVSSLQQDEKGTSLTNQKELGIDLSKRLGMKHQLWNEGGKSSFGDLYEREVLCDLLDGMKDGIVKHLYVYDIDRLSRNKDSWYGIVRELEKYNVSIYVGDGTKYDLKNEIDEFMFGIFSLVSTWDSKQRTRRSGHGKVRKFLEGYYVHGTDIFGYDRVRKKRGVKLVEHKEKGKIVRKIFQLYSKGKSVLDIKDYLLKNKIKTSRGKDVFSDKQILDMLRRKTYHGELTWTDKHTEKTYNGECTKLVEDDIWYEVQKRLETVFQKSRQKNRQKHDYLLTGVLYCGVCGYLMRGLTHEKTYRHLYYCGTKEERYRNGKLKSFCDKEKSKSVNIKRLDGLVWNTLIETVENSNILKEQVKQNILGKGKNDKEEGIKSLLKEKNKLMKDLRSQLRKQEIKEEDLYTMWVKDTIDTEQRDKFIKEVLKIKMDLLGDIQRVEKDKQRLSQSSRWIDWISVYVQNIDKLKSIEDITERKNVVQEYIRRIEVSYDTDTKLHNVEIDLRLRLFNDKYVVVGSTTSGKRKYDILEGETKKEYKLGETKSGRKSKKKVVKK